MCFEGPLEDVLRKSWGRLESTFQERPMNVRLGRLLDVISERLQGVRYGRSLDVRSGNARDGQIRSLWGVPWGC